MASCTYIFHPVFKWKEGQTDLSECSGCEEVIFSKNNFLTLGNKEDSKFKAGTIGIFCDSCKSIVDESLHQK